MALSVLSSHSLHVRLEFSLLHRNSKPVASSERRLFLHAEHGLRLRRIPMRLFGSRSTVSVSSPSRVFFVSSDNAATLRYFRRLLETPKDCVILKRHLRRIP